MFPCKLISQQPNDVFLLLYFNPTDFISNSTFQTMYTSKWSQFGKVMHRHLIAKKKPAPSPKIEFSKLLIDVNAAVWNIAHPTGSSEKNW